MEEKHICPLCGQEVAWEAGAESLRKKWGRSFIERSGEIRDYTLEELEELERIYQMQSAEYKGAITPRMEYNLQKIAKLELEQLKNITAGDGQEAKRYADIINTIKKSEGMTAADSKPLEKVKVDGLIDALEKKGILHEGKIIGKEELLKLLSKERHEYSTSRDVVDCMMMEIVNTMRANNGESQLSELPLSAQIEDPLHELREKPSKMEEEAMRDLGIVKPIKEGRKNADR